MKPKKKLTPKQEEAVDQVIMWMIDTTRLGYVLMHSKEFVQLINETMDGIFPLKEETAIDQASDTSNPPKGSEEATPKEG